MNSEPSARPKIRVGTSGFSYDDWVGPYYPPGTKRSEFFQHYVEDFDCLEINASYYTWLSTKTVAGLASRAPAGFRFAIKLHRSITHDRGDLMHGVEATLEQNRAFDEPPIVLAQFPQSYRPTEDAFDQVERLAAHLPNLVAEFRNSDWQTDAALQFLTQRNISLCIVDEPRLKGLARFSPVLTGPIAYFRMHGRNAAKWHAHEHAWERYDYRYTPEEIESFAEPVAQLSDRASETLVFFNNHYGAQAVDNARQLAAVLGIGRVQKQPRLFD